MNKFNLLSTDSKFYLIVAGNDITIVDTTLQSRNVVSLTSQGLDIFLYFCNSPNMIVTKEKVGNSLTPKIFDAETVSKAISRLKVSLRPAGESLIETVYRQGYRLNAEIVSDYDKRLLPNRYHSNDENLISYYVDCWVRGLENLGLNYFKLDPHTKKIPAENDIENLTRLLDQADGIPAPELVKLSKSMSMFTACSGCGLGGSELLIAMPFFNTLWEKRITYRDMFETDSDALSQAAILAKKEVHHRLRGEHDDAVKVSNFIINIIDEFDSTGKESASLKLALQIKESISPERFVDLGFKDRIAECYGEVSYKMLRAMRCFGCRQAFAGEEGFESTFHDLLKMLEKLKANAPNSELLKYRDAYRDILFTRLVYLEKISESDECLQIKLNDFGYEKLSMLARECDNPIRKAMLYYWMYCAKGRNDVTLINDALMLLATRTTVKHICVTDVVKFKERLIEERSRFQY